MSRVLAPCHEGIASGSCPSLILRRAGGQEPAEPFRSHRRVPAGLLRAARVFRVGCLPEPRTSLEERPHSVVDGEVAHRGEARGAGGRHYSSGDDPLAPDHAPGPPAGTVLFPEIPAGRTSTVVAIEPADRREPGPNLHGVGHLPDRHEALPHTRSAELVRRLEDWGWRSRLETTGSDASGPPG